MWKDLEDTAERLDTGQCRLHRQEMLRKATSKTGSGLCFQEEKACFWVQAQLGTASLLGIGGNPVKLGLRRVTLHPRYNPGTLDFDVAVLELARPLVFSKYIQSVCLSLAIQKFPVGSKCMISGWSSTQEGNGEGWHLLSGQRRADTVVTR